MALTPVTTPKIVKRLLPKLIWNISSKEKAIYLTFDDGPTAEITDWTLDILKQHNAKATFFCIGKNIEAHPDIFKRIRTEGHSVGNHTYNHIKGWQTKTKDYIENILKAEDTFISQLPSPKFGNQKSPLVNLFRPPYGQIKPKQAKKLRKLGYKIIMWEAISVDWDQSVSKEKCLENVIKNTAAGGIVVFHDSVKASRNMQYALPKTLEYFSEKGFEFKRIPG